MTSVPGAGSEPVEQPPADPSQPQQPFPEYLLRGEDASEPAPTCQCASRAWKVIGSIVLISLGLGAGITGAHLWYLSHKPRQNVLYVPSAALLPQPMNPQPPEAAKPAAPMPVAAPPVPAKPTLQKLSQDPPRKAKAKRRRKKVAGMSR